MSSVYTSCVEGAHEGGVVGESRSGGMWVGVAPLGYIVLWA